MRALWRNILSTATPLDCSIGPIAMVIAALVVTACSSTQDGRVEGLDSRFGWPCNRLVLEWPVEADVLQQTLSEPLKVRSIQGKGGLQLHVLHCEPVRPALSGATALTYAFVLVPVSGNSAPIGLTQVPSEGWFAVQRTLPSGIAKPMLERLGYPLVEATEISMSVVRSDTERASAALLFDGGRITIEAITDSQPASKAANFALLGAGVGHVSIFFGEERFQRSAVKASVRLLGSTPLSDYGLSATPAVAFLDRSMVADRIFWRVAGAHGGPQGTRNTHDSTL